MDRRKKEITKIITIILIIAITAITTTTITIDNPFSIKYVSAQFQVGTPGNDQMIGYPNSYNEMYGDYYPSMINTQGGNDQMTGGINSYNQMYGDAYEMSSGSTGGND